MFCFLNIYISVLLQVGLYVFICIDRLRFQFLQAIRLRVLLFIVHVLQCVYTQQANKLKRAGNSTTPLIAVGLVSTVSHSGFTFLKDIFPPNMLSSLSETTVNVLTDKEKTHGRAEGGGRRRRRPPSAPG